MAHIAHLISSGQEWRIAGEFVKGHLLMMSLLLVIVYQALNRQNLNLSFRQFEMYLPLIVCIVSGLVGAVVCWSVLRFGFPKASRRFINFTRILFHVMLAVGAVLYAFGPSLWSPDWSNTVFFQRRRCWGACLSGRSSGGHSISGHLQHNGRLSDAHERRGRRNRVIRRAANEAA